MSEITAVTTDSFKEEVLNAAKPVLVDFWAEWCGPCRRMTPVIDEIAQEVDTVKVCKINVEQNPQLAGLYQIQSIPTFMVFHSGQPVVSKTGLHSKQSILQMIGC